MKIFIETSNLIDYPYTRDIERLFYFDKEKVDGLVSEILYASPTCYLVSGYRGSGKTSFIKKVQERCDEEIEVKNLPKRVIFVHSNFSRFENRTNFLRKIIRDLNETVLRLQKNKDAITSNLMKELLKKTFYEVKEQHTKSTEFTEETEASIDFNEVFKRILKAATPILAIPTWEIIASFIPAPVNGIARVLRVLVYLVGIGLPALNLFRLSKKYSLKRAASRIDSEESVTDDDIINFYLEDLIRRFRSEGYKLVFVLDELDKIEKGELDSLLKEMKPWLVKGEADFILVAGQQLTMRYYQLREADDEIMASLFSKVIHTTLLKEFNLINTFDKLLFKGVGKDGEDAYNTEQLNPSDPEYNTLTQIRDYYIYRSKLLPRTFMNLVRQDLKWKDNRAFLQPQPVLTGDVQKINLLRDFFEKITLSASIPETAKDYIYMHVYRLARNLVCTTAIETAIPKLNSEYPLLADTINDVTLNFFQTAEMLGLIKLKKYLAPTKKTTGPTDQATTKKEASSKVTTPPVSQFKDYSVSRREDIRARNRTAFLDLFDYLIKLWNEFTKNTQTDVTTLSLKDILHEYNQLKIFSIPEISSPLFGETIDYFRSRPNDKEVFNKAADILDSNKLLIPALMEQLFRAYTENVLRNCGLGEVSDVKALNSNEIAIGDFKIDYSPTRSDAVPIFFRYQYINDRVSIPPDFIQQLLGLLNDYNINKARGTYLTQIIFSYSNFGDLKKEEVNAAVKIMELRPDLSGKLRFIIIQIGMYNTLLQRIKELKFEPYRLVPLIDKNAPKIRGKKGGGHNSKSLLNSNAYFDPEDPQKGRWGGQSISLGRELTATVRETPGDKEWFIVDLLVSSVEPNNPLSGTVVFYLHPTFSPDSITVPVVDNEAVVKDLVCYEAFTVGATCDNNSTKLELDLNTIANAPPGFHYVVSKAKKK